MRSKFNTWLSLVALIIALLSAATAAIAGPLANRAASGGAPTLLSYQGRISVGDLPFDGIGYFKFAILDPSEPITSWSNDGTSSVGDEPTNAVALPVSNGLFTVLLGDTNLTNMTQPLHASVFKGSERVLRVWFSSNNTAFSQLSPDTRLASVPYALQAEEAHNADYSYYPLLHPQSLDLVASNSDLVGFSGGFTDGRYAYFVPFQNCGGGNGPATIGRIDLQNFTSGGVGWLDLSLVDSSLRCFLNGFTDGRYGYLVPFEGAKIVRFDLQDFTDAGVTWLDLALVDINLRTFNGGFTDGRYGYLVPYYGGSGNTPQGKLVRFDLQDFTPAGVTWFDLETVNSGLKGFVSGFTDGRYGYLVPGYDPDPHGRVVRFDLQNFTTDGVVMLDLSVIDATLIDFDDGFTDGRYAYFGAPAGKVVRVDLQNFTTSGVSVLDMTAVDAGLDDFYSAFTDGRYGYFVPGASENIARVDLQNFTPAGVSWLNMTALDSSLTGFNGSFTDGRYAYLAPFYANGAYSGAVARIQLFSGTNAP